MEKRIKKEIFHLLTIIFPAFFAEALPEAGL